MFTLSYTVVNNHILNNKLFIKNKLLSAVKTD